MEQPGGTSFDRALFRGLAAASANGWAHFFRRLKNAIGVDGAGAGRAAACYLYANVPVFATQWLWAPQRVGGCWRARGAVGAWLVSEPRRRVRVRGAFQKKTVSRGRSESLSQPKEQRQSKRRD